MNARDVMTPDPACCTTETSLHEVAKLMLQLDCGEIPVLDKANTPVGVVTDRDIVCRAVAKGLNPLTLSAGDVMSSPALTARASDDLEAVELLMQTRQIRRIPVVGDDGGICGIVSLADVVRRDGAAQARDVVREVSVPAR